MPDFFHQFFIVFIPLFVAMDALGVLPVYLSLTEGQDEDDKRTLVTQAVLTGLGIALIFLVAGKFVFSLLGIREDDFRIGGGLVLLIIAIRDLTISGPANKNVTHSTYVGVVPIGVPLIVGPAALTTLLILVDNHGFKWALASLLANLIFVWLIFRKSHWLIKAIGEPGSRAFGKVMALFLAAIAVMMIRVGIVNLYHLG